LLFIIKVIIMDEATASIDFDTDAKIQETIRQEFGNATLLCVAHRLRTIIDYDRVMVLDAGQLVEFDAPSVLIRQPNSRFRNLCERSGELDLLLAMSESSNSPVSVI
ncbi:P-loop containing nucleoside triphosphate hydrolase protein, partial [Syncephalis pseudoplumigaleata]